MTSYEFEKAAKNAVIEVLKDEHDIYGISIEKLNFVWFSYTLGNMKCLIYSPEMGPKYAEVTYNKAADDMYVDIYQKVSNTKLERDGFVFDANPKEGS